MVDVEGEGFEAMLTYDDRLTFDVLAACSACLEQPRAHLLEDIGTYLVSSPTTAAVRRLLRFSGVTYCDFLLSLDELPDRVRLAVPDLNLPKLELLEISKDCFRLRVQGTIGFGHVMVGVMRALADDYGTLVFLDHAGVQQESELIDIQMIDPTFAEENKFALGGAYG